jgi:hypothetical protein
MESDSVQTMFDMSEEKEVGRSKIRRVWWVYGKTEHVFFGKRLARSDGVPFALST